MNARVLAALFLLTTACGPLDLAEEGDALAGALAELKAGSEDRPDTVEIASWNVEWFGSPDDGPADEPLQQANVAQILKRLNLDLVGLVEVVSEDAFAALLTKLPGYDGLLVTDPRVEGGKAYYWAGEQKVGLIFKKRFTVDSARVVLTASQWDFAGRPPLELKLSFLEGGKPRTLVVVVAHFKAMANADGYARRLAGAAALKTFLDTEYPSRWVLVVGDFNDDLDESTYRRKLSPFEALAKDPAYRFTTEALTEANTSTTVHFSATIDHHLATDELAQRFVAGSAKVLRVDAFVPAYGDSTSDHYPVLTRYDLR